MVLQIVQLFFEIFRTLWRLFTVGVPVLKKSFKLLNPKLLKCPVEQGLRLPIHSLSQCTERTGPVATGCAGTKASKSQ